MSKCLWCGKQMTGLTFSAFCSKRCSSEHKQSQANASGFSKFLRNLFGIIVILFILLIIVGSLIGKNHGTSNPSVGNTVNNLQNSDKQSPNQAATQVSAVDSSRQRMDSSPSISQTATVVSQPQLSIDSAQGAQDSCTKANGERFVDYAEAGRIAEVRRIAEVCPKIIDYQNRHRKRTALMYAADHDRIDVLNYLLSKNVSLNIQDRDGRTALIDAADRKNLPVSSALLDAGADQNLQEIDGLTPLMIAVEKKNVPLVTALMAHKPDLSLKNKAGKTAFDIASDKRNGEILAVLNQPSR